MSDYDNTNKGAAFKPFPEQKFILQGKLQITHNDINQESGIALIMAENKDGKKRIEVYQKVGVLFDNDKKGNDNAPDYSGPLDGISEDLRIAAWKEMKGDNAYLSFRVSPKMDKPQEDGYPITKQDVVLNDLKDDIPF